MVLVTGGTGLVGSHLLYFLLKDGQQVRAIHRKSSRLEDVKTVFSYYTAASEEIFNKIEWMEANITEIPALEAAFKGVNQVYHAAAFISFDPKKYIALKKANVEGTANIVNLCISHNVSKLCYVSSIATLGNSLNGELISEETEWNPEEKNSVYGITKFGAEMEVWRGSQEGLNVFVVNPGVVLGSGFWQSGSGSLISRAATKQNYYPSGSMGFVDVLDVVDVMIILMKSDINNERYVLVGENLSYKSLQTQLSELFNKPKPKPLSKFILVWLSYINWFTHVFFGRKRRLIKSTVDTLYKKKRYDNSKIKEDLNFSFRPAEETLKRVAERYSISS